MITFDNYVGKDAMTKAQVITVEGNENLNVLVNAYLRPAGAATPFDANFMESVAVNAKTGEYSPAKYWPAADQVVDFVSWVPADNIQVTDATLTFTVPAEAEDQVDLLVANPVIGKNGATETTKTPVSLLFKHLLSRISFEIVATDLPTDGVNVVTLEELSLNGAFASTGTVTMTDAAPKVTANMTTPTAKYEMKSYFGYTNGVMTNSTGNAATEYLMIIPDQNAPTHITVTYVVTTYATDADGKPTTTVVGTPITNTTKFALQPEEGSFAYAAGKAYKYKFSIAMDTISFEVTEDEWVEESPVDIENNYEEPATQE